MYRELSKLIMYRELGEKSIITGFANIIRDLVEGDSTQSELINRIYAQIHELLKVSTSYGFDKNLWHDYLAFVLMTNENPFSLTSEGLGAANGSVNEFALSDMMVFNRLFKYDFSKVEQALGINCFSVISDYRSIHKRKQLFNKNVSLKVRELSDRWDAIIRESEGEDEKVTGIKTLGLITGFYKDFGVGMFGLNKAFRTVRAEEIASMDNIAGEGDSVSWNAYNREGIQFVPINNTDPVYLKDLIGYEVQKKRVMENTEAFLEGRPANNVLLFGDAGTGKSTTIKALITEYYPKGLRMIELYKHQMKDLSSIISSIKSRNYRFIIYMDDLSFEEDETEYKYLKAVIEGGLETRPDNVLIYATSNRRNLIKETWNDINDIDIDKHHSDTVQEKLSLVSRFGVTIGYVRPNKREFDNIVKGLAERHPEIKLDEKALLAEATKWEISHGGMTGRSAQQFIDYLMGKTD